MKRDTSDKSCMLILMHIGKLLNDRMRASLGKVGIHFGQARILVALLNNETLNQGAIANGLHIKPPTVTNLLKKMEATGLVDRRRDANNDRIINVKLTTQGRKAAYFAVDVMDQIEDDICAQLTKKELETIETPLIKVRNILGGSTPTI